MLLVHLTWALDMFASDVAAKRAGLYDLERIRAKLVCTQEQRCMHTYIMDI